MPSHPQNNDLPEQRYPAGVRAITLPSTLFSIVSVMVPESLSIFPINCKAKCRAKLSRYPRSPALGRGRSCRQEGLSTTGAHHAARAALYSRDVKRGRYWNWNRNTFSFQRIPQLPLQYSFPRWGRTTQRESQTLQIKARSKQMRPQLMNVTAIANEYLSANVPDPQEGPKNVAIRTE